MNADNIGFLMKRRRGNDSEALRQKDLLLVILENGARTCRRGKSLRLPYR